MIEQHIISFLKATALSGHHVVVGKKTLRVSNHCVVVGVTERKGVRVHDGKSGYLAEADLSLRVITSQPATISDTVGKIRDALDGYVGFIGDIEVTDTIFDHQVNLGSNTEGVWEVVMEFTIKTNKLY